MEKLIEKYYKLQKKYQEIQKIEFWSNQDMKNYLDTKYAMADIENTLKDTYGISIFRRV